MLPGPIGAIKMMKEPLKRWKRNWFAIEAIPLYFVTVAAPGAGLWYFFRRAAAGPDIVWSRENSTPWNTIAPDETPKLGMRLGPRKDASGLPQHQYSHRWTRPESIRRERSGEVVTYESILDDRDRQTSRREENRGE